MNEKEFMELVEKARAMTVDQQRVFVRCFDVGLLLRAVVDRVAFLEEYYTKSNELGNEYSTDTYMNELLERIVEKGEAKSTKNKINVNREDQVKKTKEEVVEASNG